MFTVDFDYNEKMKRTEILVIDDATEKPKHCAFGFSSDSYITAPDASNLSRWIQMLLEGKYMMVESQK